MSITSPLNFGNKVGQVLSITIDQTGNTKSEAITTNGNLLTHIVIGTTWDAASITFEASIDGTNFYAVKDDAGTTYTVTASSSQVITIPASKLIGGTYAFKIVSTAAQNTGSPRTINIVIREV